jgi:hypothetical protein
MPMIKCTILLPNLNNKGISTDYEQAIFLEKVEKRFGGYTIVSENVHGVYHMENGERAVDRLSQVIVCIDPPGLGELKKMAADFGRDTGQETVYFEVSLSNVEFLPSAPDHATTGFNCPKMIVSY